MSTDDKRCELTDLVTWMCAHCLGHETEWVDQFLKDESAD